MAKSFFPPTGRRVVPILKLEDDDEITLVEDNKDKSLAHGARIRIMRLAIGSLLKASVIKIESDDLKVDRPLPRR
jgi:hypothetical protein